MLILRHRDVRKLMDLPEYVAAVEAAYREVGAGRGVTVPRQSFRMDGGGRVASRPAAAGRGSFTIKAAVSSRLGAGVSMYTTGLPAGLRTYLALWDLESGELVALIDSLYYDWLKTGAVVALATRYLAPPEAPIVALFGTGRHARMQLRAICSVKRVERAQVFGRDADRRERFAREAAGALGIDVVAAPSPRAALRGARIVTTITTAPTPVFDGRDLDAGPLLVNAMGAHHPAREVDEYVVSRSRVIVDDRAQALLEKGEIAIPIEERRMTESVVAGDLGEVVGGRMPPDDLARRWTLFLSGGTGIEDVGVAGELVQRARERDVGLEIPFEVPEAREWAL